MKKILCLLLIGILSTQLMGSMTVKLSKDKVKINEPVTISLITQNEKNLDYTLELSSNKYDIIGEQHNVKSENINGKESMNQEDSYTIVPKSLGEQTIKIKFKDGKIIPLRLVVVQ